MAKLRFFARDDQLVAMPGFHPVAGQLPMYVGRRFDAALTGFPATQEPAEFDTETSAGQRLMQLTRRDGALWAADPETAALCGVSFVETSFRDGVVSEKMTVQKPADAHAEEAE